MQEMRKFIKWCMQKKDRLRTSKPDIALARMHLKKSQYNYVVLGELNRLGYNDWAVNVGFYSIYHCFLAILAKFGFQSRNQSCTVGVMLMLVDKGKINLDKDYIFQFDTLEENAAFPTIRDRREYFTYGVETSIDLNQIEKIRNLIINLQKETIRIIEE